MSTTASQQFALLVQARTALASARTLEDIRRIRDQADAVRLSARRAPRDKKLANFAAELKLRAERMAGECLRRLRLRGGNRRSSRSEMNLKLSDLDISHNQSSRWQKAADMPSKLFEQYLRDCWNSGSEATVYGILRGSQLKLKPASRRAPSDDPQGTRGVQRTSNVPCRDGFDEVVHVLSDAHNHCLTLSRVLDPLLANESPELHVKRQHLVRRLLTELGESIHQASRNVQHR